jgi:ribosome assembly protein 4
VFFPCPLRLSRLCPLQDDDPVPFAFYIALPSEAVAAGAPTRLNIARSLDEDVLQHSSQAFSTEDILVVRCSPQAVFRVRPATRCSSTLSGPSSSSPPPRRPLRVCRTRVANPVRRILADRRTPSDRCRRLPRPSLGPGNRVAVACARGSQRLGSLRRVGGSRAPARDRRARRTCMRSALHPNRPLTRARQVRLWEPKTGKPIGDALKGHSKWVTSLAWEPIHMCASSSIDMPFFSCPSIHRNAATPRLASASKDGTVRVWAASGTRALEYTLGGHSASVNAVRWGGGGAGGAGVIYTASSDRTVRVWDANGVRDARRVVTSLSTEMSTGEAAARAQGSCTLGHDARAQHRLCAPNGPVRPHREAPLIGRGRYVPLVLIVFILR